MRLRRAYIGVVIAVAGGAVAAAVFAASYSNGTPITVNDASAGSVATASPYPSTITVAGESTLVTDVNVKLAGFQHGFSDDFDVLLQSPSGAAVVLMSDAGDGNPVSGRTFLFDDSAGSTLPDESPPATGTYRPVNFGRSAAPYCHNEPDPDTFPDPAPAAPGGGYPSALSTFNGTAANGDWKLFVVDDCHGDAGVVVSGWSITINSAPTAVGVRGLSGRALPGRVELRWRTAAETAIAGFNVFRTSNGLTKRLNARPIAAKHAGAANGATYRFVDRRVRPGASYTYRLQVVRLDGTRQNAGLVALRTAG
jgi:subtilisin-like proprotein convertase family protein